MSRKLTDWIDSFLEMTDNSEGPRSYREWVAIGVVAAAMQRKCFLEWEGRLFPNMYIILVGPPGVRKGTAMRPGRVMLDKLGIKLVANKITAERLIQRLEKADSQAITRDGTIMIHHSLTVFSEELVVFLGKDNDAFLANLCDWFDCSNDWSYETKNSGDAHINGVWFNLVGATTPDLIKTSLPPTAIGGGLSSRMIFVYEGKSGKITPLPSRTEKEKALERALESDLEDIYGISGEYKYTSAFADLYVPWYINHRKNPIFTDDRLARYCERRQIHLLKLCMIYNASRNGGQLIDACDFNRALATLEAAEKKMPMTFSAMGQNELADVTQRVMGSIAANQSIDMRRLLQLHWRDADKFTMSRIIATLEAQGFCRTVVSSEGVTIRLTAKTE